MAIQYLQIQEGHVQVSSGQGKENTFIGEKKVRRAHNERVMVVHDLSPCQESRSLSSSLGDTVVTACKAPPSGSPTCIEFLFYFPCLVGRLCQTLCYLVDCRRPSFSVHVLFVNFCISPFWSRSFSESITNQRVSFSSFSSIFVSQCQEEPECM